MASIYVGSVGGIFKYSPPRTASPPPSVIAATVPPAPPPLSTPTSVNLNWNVDTWAKTIPLSMGNRRLAGEMLWATAITTVAGINYISFAVSFGYPLKPSEYSSLSVNRVWANGNLIVDETTSPPVGMPGLTMRFYPGSRFQAVDPLIQSARGAGVASAYRPLIYLVFEAMPLANFQNQVPFISIELLASGGRINVSDVILAVAAKSGYAAGDVTVSGIADQCDGAIITQDVTLQQFLQQLAQPYNFSILDSDKIAVIRRGVGGSLSIDAVLTDDNLISESDTDDVFNLERAEDTSVPNQVEISYLDVSIDYQSSQQMARRPVAPVPADASTVTNRYDLPLIITAKEALALAYITLYRGWVEQPKLLFKLLPHWLAIEPGDVLSITSAAAIYIARVVESKLTPKFTNEITAEVLLTDTSGSWNTISGTIVPSQVRFFGLDPTTAVNLNITQGGIVATPNAAAAAFASVAKTSFKRNGKWYLEYVVAHQGASGDGVGLVAYAGTSAEIDATLPTNCVVCQLGIGGAPKIYAERADTGKNIGARSTGDIVGIAVDLDDWLIWFRVTPSANWNGDPLADPATATGGISIGGYANTIMGPFASFKSASFSAGGSGEFNFGQSTFHGATPSGFTAGWTPAGDAESDGGFTVWTSELEGTVDDGQLIVQHASTTQGYVKSGALKNVGRYYFEITILALGSNSDTRGLATFAATAADLMTGNVNCAEVITQTGNIFSNDANTGDTLGALAVGNVIGIAVDFSHQTVWFRKAPSGYWNGNPSANPATNTGGESISNYASLAPFVGFNNNASQLEVLNAGNSPFVGAVPSGFTAGWPS